MADGFAMLEHDHREVGELFDDYEQRGDPDLARQICFELTVHGEIEEQVLYPELRRLVDGGDDLANEAENEHALVKSLVARLFDSPPDDLRPLVLEIGRDVAAHVRWEETDLFAAMRESGVDAEALGTRLEAARGEAPSRSSGQVG